MSRRALFLALLAFVFVTACADSTAPTTITGDYILRTVNGANMPYVRSSSTSRIELLNETITLLDGGVFRTTGTVRFTEGTVSNVDTYSYEGTFTHAGSSIALTYPGDAPINATFVSGTITFTLNGLTLVFRK